MGDRVLEVVGSERMVEGDALDWAVDLAVV